jgi:hypothetical protein
MNPALLRNISLETNDQGQADAQIALASRRSIDKNGDVQLNPDDLPASMRALGGGGAVPMWRKFSVSLADLQAGVEEDGKVKVRLFTAVPGTIISDGASRVTDIYDAPVEEALPMDSLQWSVGKTGAEQIFYDQQGCSPPAEDIGNWVRSTAASAQANAQMNFLKVETDVNAYFSLNTEPFTAQLDLATAALFTAGSVDIWLLISVLP